jgi:hypothetical protein
LHSPCAAKKSYDFSEETLHWEGTPSLLDLGANVLLGFTLVCIPLTIAAVGRTAFVKYRFTDKRVSVTTTAPWKSEGGGLGGWQGYWVRPAHLQQRRTGIMQGILFSNTPLDMPGVTGGDAAVRGIPVQH